MKLFTRDSSLDLSRPHVVGILNVTPDLFSDGGAHDSLVEVVKHANLMISAGAATTSASGESTCPGAADVGVGGGSQRVILTVEAVAQRFKVWISVDTSKPEMVRECARTDTHIISDIYSFSGPGALEAAAGARLPVRLMHMQGQPEIMQKAPKCGGVFAEVNHYFVGQITRCEWAGIAKDGLLFDPRFGFSKNLTHNCALLVRLSEFHHFNLSLLVGISRRSMTGQLLNVGPSERLSSSLAYAVIAVIQGAQIVRVHDIKETVEVMYVVEATLFAKGKERYEWLQIFWH